MTWIEETLADLARRRQGLQAAPPGANAPQPTGMAGGFHPGPRGMVDRSQALGVGEQDRTLALVQGYQKYLKRSGRQHDPITDALKLTPQGRGMRAVEQAPGELETGPGGQAFQVTQHGPRAGLVHQRYDLGDGLKANVYYDPATGEREVVRFRSRRPPAKGAARVGSAGKGIIR